jgi:hypothetical protein
MSKLRSSRYGNVSTNPLGTVRGTTDLACISSPSFDAVSAQLVEALRCMPEGRGFDSGLCLGIFH